MIAIVLALATSIGWGASDYFGGRATRRATSVFVVVALAELLGVLPLLPVLLARGASPPGAGRLLLAATAGVAVTVELSLIYRALGRGQSFITAPTGALGTAIAVGVGLVGGDRLDPAMAIGLLCALLGSAASVWTPAAGERRDGDRWQTLGICAGAALAVGTMLTTLHAAGRLDPYWATATEHAATGFSAAGAALYTARGPVRKILPERAELPNLVVIAAVGVGGDLAYTGASHHGGSLSVVAAISALYPVTTIVLGRLLQGSRATRIQLIGTVVALAGGALLAATSP